MADITIAPIGDNGVVTVTQGQPFDLIVTGKDAVAKAKISKATLTSNGKTIKGKIVVADGVHWAVRFVIKKVDPDHPYTVHIEDDGGKTADTDVTFKDVPPPPPGPAGKGRRARIAPPPNSTEPGSGFYVTGAGPVGDTIYGYMDQPDGPMYFGSPSGTPDDYAVLFQNIPPGANYAITIVYYGNPVIYNVIPNITIV